MNSASNAFKTAVAAIFIVMTTVGAQASDRPAHSGAKLYGDADRGRVVFSKWCASCHGNAAQASDQIPTLQQLAGDPGRTDGLIRAFLFNPHQPMPPLSLENQQIEDIVAYLHSVKAASARPQT